VFRDKYLITAFHRVNERTLGGGISCSPRSFRRICSWLARNFRVVSLAEQVQALESGRILPNTASITFDDGYLDNYEIAAPILRELGLPATFFVATDFIGSTTVPAWDEYPDQARWMTWDHLRDLVKQGFDVESHTCTHIDMGVVDRECARQELSMSLTRLNDALGSRQRMFAYPFGGKENITEPMRTLVEQAGYRCCLSCHGGINTRHTSAYSLWRMPVNEEYESPEQFGLELLRAAASGDAGIARPRDVHPHCTEPGQI
jgi:peptidoglycan/xylan/chitin deacetylase (PgdA/CDA1 family)